MLSAIAFTPIAVCEAAVAASIVIQRKIKIDINRKIIRKGT